MLGSGVVAKINKRFHADPYSYSWSSTGSLADAGVLIHVIDGWEEVGYGADGKTLRAWRSNKDIMSCSLIFADQRPPGHEDTPIQVYNRGLEGVQGLVFRPGSSMRIRCCTAKDSGSGHCRKDLCPHITLEDARALIEAKRAASGGHWWRLDDFARCSYAPEDFGAYLYRDWAWMKEQHCCPTYYNEVVVDGLHWTEHLPDTIEAFFGTGDLARTQHRAFLREYGLSAQQVPLLAFDLSNWDEPFSLAAG